MAQNQTEVPARRNLSSPRNARNVHMKQIIEICGCFILFLFWGMLPSDTIKRMKKLLLALFFFALGAFAQTRSVTLTWTASTSTGVTGYIVSTSSSATGTFTAIGCTGSVPSGSVPSTVTCVSGSTSTTTTFVDPAETIGNTVYYELQATAAACPSNTTSTPSGSSTTACGVGTPTSVVGVVIQPRATAPATLAIILI